MAPSSDSKQRRRKGVLDNLGNEVTGLVAPVTLCMALVVALVRILNPDGSGSRSGSSVAIATLAYNENATDSAKTKAGGAFLNAIIFVAIIAGLTFILVFLYWLGCSRFIKGYFFFSMFSIFFILTGLLGVKLLQAFQVHMDAISYLFYLYNFSVVGVLATVQVIQCPLLVRQGYTVIIGIVVAFLFTYIPQWTAWVIIGLMAVYDLWAVLASTGPLALLLKVMQRRNEPLTALVYESRPANMANYGRPGQGVVALHQGRDADGNPLSPPPSPPPPEYEDGEGDPDPRPMVVAPDRPLTLTARDAPLLAREPPPVTLTAREEPETATIYARESRGGVQQVEMTHRASKGRAAEGGANGGANGGARGQSGRARTAPSQPGGDETFTTRGGVRVVREAGANDTSRAQERVEEEDEDEDEGKSGFKLGLGDFIFYSMLMGRAAMSSYMSVFASFLAIIFGMVGTLLLLVVFERALPALPISIALGILFYFITELSMQVLLVPMSLSLVFF